MNKLIYLLVIALPLLSNAQTVIPTTFYGTNAWMPDSIGTKKYWGKLDNNWTNVKNSNVQIIRVGGIAPDKEFYTNYQILNMIDSIKAAGAEPLIQVPLWAGGFTSANAANIVTYINVTKSKGVKYWSIGNEPNFVYNESGYGFSANNYSYSDYATDVKAFSVAMKTVDPTIKIVAADLVGYTYSSWTAPLLTPGGADDITGNNGTHDYVDYFSYHSYPFQGDASQTRANVIKFIDDYKTNYLNDINTKLTVANAYHTRNNDLGFMVTELNVAWKEPTTNNISGVGSKSFLAGQWWADMLLANAEGGAASVQFWSVMEGGGAYASSDHGYIDNQDGTLRSTYYHFQMCAKYMTDTLLTTTDNQDSVRAYVTKNPDFGYTVMVLNYDYDNDFTMRLRLNNDAVSGGETLKINTDAKVAKEMTETIPAKSTVWLFLSPTGDYIGKYTYSQSNTIANTAPTFTSYTPTRAPKVFAHYLPWFDDGTGGHGRSGWCHEGDCTDANNKSSVYTPLIGEYSQFDEEVLKYHIRMAIAARIDGFIVNVNPKWDFQWKVFNNLCDAALAVNNECGGSNDFKIILSYDNSTESDVPTVTTYFQLVEDSLYNHEQFKDLVWKDDITGKPILTVWSEANWANYRTAIDAVFGKDSIMVLGQNATNFDYVDGNFGWVGYLNSSAVTNNWGEQYYNDFAWIMARQQEFGLSDIRNLSTVQMLSAYPGFNDSNVPAFWNGGNARYHLRDVDDGETMSLTWDKTLNYTPLSLGGDLSVSSPWVQLVTWNDFPEGTCIEPSLITQQGFQDLQTTRSKIATFKNITTNNEDTLGIYVPYEIYNAVKAGRTADASTALTLFCSEDYNQAYSMAKSGVLPVELLTFTGERQQNHILLNWEVGSKINHSHFEIEHSTDGIRFQQIGTDDRWQTFYEFLHKNPSKGVNYYRLRQVDKDGQFEYSDIISVDMPTSQWLNFNSINQQLTIISEKQTQLKIFTTDGKLVFVDNFTGFHQLDLSFLEKGVYLVVGQHHNSIERIKIVRY